MSLTTDAAKMPTGDSYVAVTGLWVSLDWKLMSAVFAVSISNVPHTAQEIVAFLNQVGAKYTLDDRPGLQPLITIFRKGFVRSTCDALAILCCSQ